METVQVKIMRKKPGEKEGHFQEYRVDIESFGSLSVLNILEKITLEQDTGLSYFHHAACRQGACGKCLMKINGKSRLACKELVTGPELTLEPSAKNPVKDLV